MSPINAFAWPATLSWPDVSASLGANGIAPIADSLLARRAELATATGGRAIRERPVLEALRAVAAPRRILLLATRDGTAALLFDGDRAIARADMGSEGLTLGEPCQHDVFATAVASLAPRLSSEAYKVPPTRVSLRFLSALSALDEAGVFTSPDGVDRRQAETALGPLAGSEQAGKIVTELVEQGVLQTSGELVQPRADWCTNCGFLLGGLLIELKVLAIAGVETAATQPTVLITGGEVPHAAVLPSLKAGQDALIEFRPAIPGHVELLVRQLISEPPGPPTLPSEASTVDFERLLMTPISAAPAHPWKVSRPEEAVVPGRLPDAPTALGTPQLTIQALCGRAGDARRELTVIAVDCESAAEWQRDGDLLRWRPMASAALARRLEELAGVEDSTAVHPGPSLAIDRHALARLLSSGVSSGGGNSALLPKGMADVTDPLRFTLIAATNGTGAERRSVRLLLLRAPGGEAWVIGQEAGSLVAERVDGSRTRRRIRDALVRASRTIGDANGSL